VDATVSSAPRRRSIPVTKREIFGWAMFDFANSCYTTVVITLVYGKFFVSHIVPEGSRFENSSRGISFRITDHIAQPERQAIDDDGVEPAGLPLDDAGDIERLLDGGPLGPALRPMPPDALGHLFIERLPRGQKRAALKARDILQGETALAATRSAANQDYTHRLLRRERRSQMKNGPPSIAVITPTGISLGASIVRAIVSQIIRNPAPTKNDAGINTRWSAPKASRKA
jgi:hypothetical protein